MNKLLLMVLMVVLALTGCTMVSPDPGQEAVLIDKPILFGDGGVRLDDVRPAGLTYTWWTTEKEYIDVTPQTVQVQFDDFSSSDNILLDFQTQIQYRITGSGVLLAKFGKDWFKNNVASQYAAIVRDQVKRYDMTKMMSDPNTASQIDTEVTKQVRELLAEQKIPVEIMNVTLGKAKPNPNVLEQMNQTAAQQQRVKTLVEATNAENQREQEQLAKAKADNAYRQAMSLSPEMYLAREIAELNAEACKAAKGGCYMVPSGTSVLAK
ncbi:SPFH domain-containing protein [Stenotrophomonas phage vB_SmaS_DLP_5]|uniref:SPFH domain-containing protein n=1 Tax=Stenotrophomonas phage vB_SmaS_DLP_5 TaxID=2044561 RepID=A0A2D2W2L0_9CAUD|nr:SPFH domain-containing protein [Stenotrophomonas phage vB_SmaS_DLP_5]ATS92309.1 SPFH domain-containing protein [Stenotrophomonas phage vB_SmaS_DLP_5]